jgi:hypothetical protein
LQGGERIARWRRRSIASNKNTRLETVPPVRSTPTFHRPSQGANDPRVKQAEAEQIVAAIEKNGGRVSYVLYPDEGHGFARPENRIDFNARAEAFLAENMGGRCEPVAGEKIPGSTAVVREVGKKAITLQ